MQHSIDCLPCLLQQAVRIAKNHLSTEEAQTQLVRRIMGIIANIDGDVSAPYIAHKIQISLKEALNNPDPYQKDKEYYNYEMLKLENEMTQLLASAEDPFDTGLKLAAAGNIIDFGPGYELSREVVLRTIKETLAKEYQQEVSQSLKAALEHADQILYLGDNAGEIVLDKVFIQTIKACYPELEVYFATRGKPVLNDITEADAYLVGMDRLAKIINNGTDIPGTVLEHCSSDFGKVFAEADVIISKGQGNFESLYGCGRDNLYYIFLCKCNLFMEKLGARQNDIMLMKE